MKKVYEFDAILHEIPKKGGVTLFFPGISEKNLEKVEYVFIRHLTA